MAESLKRKECELLVEPLPLEEGRRLLEAAKQRTLWQTLTRSAARKPDHAALVAGDDAGNVTRLTYRELVERATSLSAGLAGGGSVLAADLSSKEKLGEALFSDTALSANRTQSCADCHNPDFGFADPRSGAGELSGPQEGNRKGNGIDAPMC